MVFIDPECDITLIPSIWGKNQDEVLPFTPELNQLKTLIEQQTDFKFNICLANYYDNGKRSIGFHADNEEKGSTSCIASVSLGASRTFLFRTTGEKEPCLSLTMNGYSLLIMGQGCQENYQHSVPIDKTCKSSRLNLTFRLFDSMRYK
jgi:alkylated DNA repair dioxygenase AlkB